MAAAWNEVVVNHVLQTGGGHAGREVTKVNKRLNSDSKRPRLCQSLAKGCAMNLRSPSSHGLKAPLLGCLVALAMAAPATADSFYRDHAFADSFGNLVVYSPSGYKRIVVGKGYLADRLASAAESDGPHVVRLHDASRHHAYVRDTYARRGECAVLLHGRSYMYGLPENVVPVPAKDCD